MHLDEPETIVAARQDSPLIIGIGEGETIVASDIPAVLEYTREVLVLHDGEIATVTPAVWLCATPTAPRSPSLR